MRDQQKDAKRYRWLRDQSIIDWDCFPFPDGYEHPDDALDSEALMLDASIDAVLTRKEQ